MPVDDLEPGEVAHRAAIDTILQYVDPEEIDDLDVTVTFDDGELTIDIYLHVPGKDSAPIVTEAIEAGTAAVDELFDA